MSIALPSNPYEFRKQSMKWTTSKKSDSEITEKLVMNFWNKPKYFLLHDSQIWSAEHLHLNPIPLLKK